MLLVDETATESPAVRLSAGFNTAAPAWLFAVEALPDASDWRLEFRPDEDGAAWVPVADLAVGVLREYGSDTGAYRVAGSAAGAIVRAVTAQAGFGNPQRV